MKHRRECINFDVGPFTTSVGFDETDAPCEIFICARGKSGTDIDDVLYEIGVKASRIMQGKDG